jgi:hypothetical protein
VLRRDQRPSDRGADGFISGPKTGPGTPGYTTQEAAEELVDAVSKGRFVSGHDFSRAVNAAKSTRPLGPVGIFRR